MTEITYSPAFVNMVMTPANQTIPADYAAQKILSEVGADELKKTLTVLIQEIRRLKDMTEDHPKPFKNEVKDMMEKFNDQLAHPGTKVPKDHDPYLGTR